MRRGLVAKRVILPDPKFNSEIVSKFANILMLKGKKSVAQHIIYEGLEIAAKKIGKEPIEIFYKALDNVRPALEVKSRRVGGATYQVPVEVRKERGTTIAMRWLRDFARRRKGKSMVEKLSDEIAEAYQGGGNAVKKKEDTHKMAEA
ncbi:MAG: 30S ribosomal protein S7, partial [Candidatus Omnitrophica bacterium]|nr:30S ribosomal protein S7 [Candidatus Omnitrophota bacterium]